VVVAEFAKKNSSKEFDFKFALRRAPVHITVRLDEHSLALDRHVHLPEHSKRRVQQNPSQVAGRPNAAAADPLVRTRARSQES
jgi:hypothetical protein